MANQQFLSALQEQDKVTFIKSLFTAMMVTAQKGLSTEDFTTVLKDKLANIEGSHFKGVFTSVGLLEAAHPAASVEAGSYAYLKPDATTPETMVLLDSDSWVEQSSGGSGAAMTASQIKSLYESNADSNPFTDAMKATLAHLVATKDLNLDNLAHDLDVVVQRTHGIDFVAGIPTDPDSNNKQDHIELAVPMQMQVAQQVPQDPAIALGSREYMTIGSVFALMNQFQSMVMKDKGTITDMGDISETGIYEGVDVIGSPIQGEIMVMANKDSHGDFGFFLMGDDRTMHTGGKKAGGVLGWQQVKHVTQSTGEIPVLVGGGFTTIQTHMYANLFGTDLMDGKEHVVTFMMKPQSPDIPDGDTAWGYIVPHVADQTGVPVRLLSAGLGGTPNGVLKLWIERKALVTIKKVDKDDPESDWEVTHVEIPSNAGVTTHSSNTFMYMGVITNMDEIAAMGVYEGTDVIGSPITGKVIIEAYADKDGDLDVSLKGQDGRRYEGGKPAGGAIHWHNVSPDHLYGTANPDNADGNDGDIYFKYH